MLCACRNHHFVADGPIQNGCPGEAVTPAELFLASVAACGVELVQVIAREQSTPLGEVGVHISGVVDRANPVRTDYTVFNKVVMRFDLRGVSTEQGAVLVQQFKRR